ncbi:hypothetical protein ACFSM5_03195 [Lacibacterium aquatile]|uniref:Uncharacterized protein n=1 Tax=Lacibacterium aquatile TaxID=1168082 RepID=A0ABW5DL74_9PROT
MDHLIRPLKSGEAIRYWQLSKTKESRYDVADKAMQGRMDATFFLTKDKNFIPHEYPCRTEFALAFRDKEPKPTVGFAGHRWWFPFGSDRVDLSGFWFRPTRVETIARTTLRAATAGPAKVLLGTCGGAILSVNGKPALWMTKYQRNYEDKREATLDLQAGDNEIEVWFDDLCERDARYFFQLDYLSGPKVAVALPVPVAGDRAESLERLLNGMRFEKPFYGAGEVAIELPEGTAADLKAEVDVHGDFMSYENVHISRDLPKGVKRLSLGDAEDLPADFRHFEVKLIDGAMFLARPLVVEICHLERQGEASSDLKTRVHEALDYLAENAEADTVCALARLATGKKGAATDKMIADYVPMIADCYDCADFLLVPLLWSRIRYGNDIGEKVRADVDAAILNYRYWLDEPGNDVQWYFSENHALLFHTCCYLAGNLFPDATFKRSGRKGAEQAKVGYQRLVEWMDHFEACEMAEWNSAPYFPIDLKGLCALYALAPDADLKARAGKAVRRLLEMVALSCHQGMLTGSQGRSYEHSLRAGRTLELSGIARLMWGRGWYGRRYHALPQLALCLRDHGLEVDPVLGDYARYAKDEPLEWTFTQGENAFAALYHYKNQHYALGTLVGYRPYQWGYQETVLHGRLGDKPESQFWLNHPGETILSGYGRPSYWGGCGALPLVQQYKGLAIARFQANEEQPDFTHIWLPEAEMDEVVLDGDRLLVRAGGGLAVFQASGPLTKVSDGPMAGCEVRLAGRTARWLVRVSDIATEGSLAGFASRMEMLRQVVVKTDSLTVTDPDYGSVTAGGDGAVQAEGRRVDFKDWTLSGVLRAADGGAVTLPSQRA